MQVDKRWQGLFSSLACVSWIRAMNLQFKDSCELCRPCVARCIWIAVNVFLATYLKSHFRRLSYAVSGEMCSTNTSDICTLNWMFDSELGEAKPCLDDFVNFSLNILGGKGIYLCEFGSQLMECLLITLLTNAGSLKLYVCHFYLAANRCLNNWQQLAAAMWNFRYAQLLRSLKPLQKWMVWWFGLPCKKLTMWTWKIAWKPFWMNKTSAWCTFEACKLQPRSCKLNMNFVMFLDCTAW